MKASQHVWEKDARLNSQQESGIGAKRSDTVLESQLMPAIYYVIRPMKYEDIPQVAQIDREAFPGEWVFRSQSAYKQDLANPSVRYVVACRKKGCGGIRETIDSETPLVQTALRL